MNIDEAWRDVQARCVEYDRGTGFREIVDQQDAVSRDPNVGGKPGVSCAVENSAAADDDVVVLLPRF